VVQVVTHCVNGVVGAEAPATPRARGVVLNEVVRAVWRIQRWCRPVAVELVSDLIFARAATVFAIYLQAHPWTHPVRDRDQFVLVDIGVLFARIAKCVTEASTASFRALASGYEIQINIVAFRKPVVRMIVLRYLHLPIPQQPAVVDDSHVSYLAVQHRIKVT